MTTIAFDGKTLAADGRAIGDFIHQSEPRKIFRVGPGLYAAGAGRWADIHHWVYWLRGGLKDDRPIFDDYFSGMLVGRGLSFKFERKLIPVPLIAPHAIGSGCQFAMAVMVAGMSAVKAVEIAKKLDEDTGGKVQSVQIHD